MSLYHVSIIPPLPEVPCIEDRTKVAFKEKHGGSRAVVGFQGCHGNAHSLPRAVDVKNAGMTNIQFNLQAEIDNIIIIILYATIIIQGIKDRHNPNKGTPINIIKALPLLHM